MTVLDTIRNRRSIRDFREEALSNGMMDKLIEVLRLALSAGNLQNRKIYFVTNGETRTGLVRRA